MTFTELPGGCRDPALRGQQLPTQRRQAHSYQVRGSTGGDLRHDVEVLPTSVAPWMHRTSLGAARKRPTRTYLNSSHVPICSFGDEVCS